MTQEEYLAHHGILGQKWGVRRYQNSDGTLTEAGKKRYAKELIRDNKKGRYVQSERTRLKLLSSAKETKDIINKARKINSDLDEEYEKWVNNPSAVKKDLKAVAKKQGWKYESIDKLYDEMGIDLHDIVYQEHINNDSRLLKKQNELMDTMGEFKKASEKVYKQVLEAYGDTEIKYIDSDCRLLDVLVDKAGYDDYWSAVYAR